MRRSTKPFTVEVKKRGGRRRDIGDMPADRNDPITPSFGQMVGRDIRFRDAENLFRAPASVDTGLAEPEAAPIVPIAPAEPAPQGPDSAPRRILPDLIAEAALSEATLAAAPEPRRRGRPPKARGDDETLPRPAKSRRRMPASEVEDDVFDFDAPEPAPAAPPAVLYLAASARRRAARATDNLPRAERWKRRLPKACW